MGHKVIQCFTLWTCSEVGVFYCLHPSFLTFWFLVAWLLHQHWELYKKSFVDLFIDWIGGYKHYRMIFKTSGKDPFIEVQQVHPTIYKFNKLRNHSEAVITTEISTPEWYTHIFHATHIKINEGTFLRARGKNRHRSSVTLGLWGCHLSPGEKALTLPGESPFPGAQLGGGSRYRHRSWARGWPLCFLWS